MINPAPLLALARARSEDLRREGAAARIAGTGRSRFDDAEVPGSRRRPRPEQAPGPLAGQQPSVADGPRPH
jgi:hypothetical protein